MAKYKIGITEAGDAGLDLSWTSKMNQIDGAILITKCVSPDFYDAALKYKDKVIIHTTFTGFGHSVLEPFVPAPYDEFDAITTLVERGKKTMIKPRICDVLGIDIGVPFKVKGYKGKYHINSDGVMKWEEQGSSNAAIYEAINHPEHIVKVISLSDQEIETIKAIKNLFPNVEYVERIKNSDIVGIGNSENGWIADINNALFPSLNPGDSIDVNEALAGGLDCE